MIKRGLYSKCAVKSSKLFFWGGWGERRAFKRLLRQLPRRRGRCAGGAHSRTHAGMGQQEGGFGSYLGSLGRRREGAGPPSRSRTDSAADLVRERLASCAEAASSLGVAERWREAAIPLLANGATALVVHTAVLSAFQVGALALRISSATPLASTLVGGTAIATASVASGMASRALQHPHAVDARSDPPRGAARLVASVSAWRAPPQAAGWLARLPLPTLEEAALDASLGLASFALLGGACRSLLPSDLRFLGSHAVLGRGGSIPAHRGAAYATPSQREELAALMRRFGCHHCGRRRGPVVGDHMPPNKVVRMLRQSADRPSIRPTILGGWGLLVRRLKARVMYGGGLTRRLRQRFYPQCAGCSAKQAGAVMADRKRLVMPATAVGARLGPAHVPAALVAARNRDERCDGRVAARCDAAITRARRTLTI